MKSHSLPDVWPNRLSMRRWVLPPNVYRPWQLAEVRRGVGRGALENPVQQRACLDGSDTTGRVRRNLHREGDLTIRCKKTDLIWTP